MTVRELMNTLANCDADMEVCMAVQANFPAMQLHLAPYAVANENGTKLYLFENKNTSPACLDSYVQGEIGW